MKKHNRGKSIITAKSWVRPIMVELATLLLFLFFYLLLIIAIPIFVLRMIVSWLVLHFDKKFVKLMHPLNSYYANCDDMYGNPTCTVTLGLVFDCDDAPTYEDVCKAIDSKIIQCKDENGFLRYPELKMYPQSCLGFQFWCLEHNFDLKEHVLIISEKVDKQRFDRILNDIEFGAWDEERSLWQAVLVPRCEYRPNEWKSLLFLRAHHSLIDGIGGFKLIARISDAIKEFNEAMEQLEQASIPEMKPWVKFVLPFLARTIGTYQFSKSLVSSYDNNAWHYHSAPLTKRNRATHLSENVPTYKLKTISKKLKVSGASIIFSSVAAATRDLMLKQGHKLPDFLHVIIPLPMPGHPDLCQNHFAFGYPCLPIKEMDPVKRLLKVDESMKILKKSFIPSCTYRIFSFVGNMPKPFSKLLGQNLNCTGLVSSFPGPRIKLKPFGHNLETYFLCGGPSIGNISFCSYVPGYADVGINFCSTFNDFVTANESWDKIEQYNMNAYQEIDSLYKIATTSS